MKWSQIQDTTGAIAQNQAELFPVWLRVLLSSAKARDLLSMQREPSVDDLSRLVEMSPVGAELVAEYHETSRMARAAVPKRPMSK